MDPETLFARSRTRARREEETVSELERDKAGPKSRRQSFEESPNKLKDSRNPKMTKHTVDRAMHFAPPFRFPGMT